MVQTMGNLNIQQVLQLIHQDMSMWRMKTITEYRNLTAVYFYHKNGALKVQTMGNLTIQKVLQLIHQDMSMWQMKTITEYRNLTAVVLLS